MFSSKELDLDEAKTSVIYHFINIGLDDILEKIKRSLFLMLDNKLNRWPTNQEKTRLFNIYEIFGYLLKNVLKTFKMNGYFCKKISYIIGEMLDKCDLNIRNHIASEKNIDCNFVIKNLTCLKPLIQAEVSHEQFNNLIGLMLYLHRLELNNQKEIKIILFEYVALLIANNSNTILRK